jgi:ribosome-associated toxin RatA of RatAB toxin-antitoxin module
MAKFSVSASSEINCSPETLAQFVLDIPNIPHWSSAFVAIRDFSGEPIGLGSTWKAVSKFMGTEFVSDNKVIEFGNGRLCVLYVDGGAFTGTNTWTFDSTEDGRALFTLNAEGETKSFLTSLAVSLLRSQAQSQMNNDIQNMKAILEA